MTRVLDGPVLAMLKDNVAIRAWDLKIVEPQTPETQGYIDVQTEIMQDGKVTLRMTTALVDSLEQAKQLLPDAIYNELVDQIFLHERLEILKIESLKQERQEGKNRLTDAQIAIQSHEFAANNAGDKQKAFLESISAFRDLQTSVAEPTPNDVARLQASLDKAKDSLSIITGNPITQAQVLAQFDTARKTLTEFVAKTAVEQREVVIDITGTKSEQIMGLITGMGLMKDGVLKTGIRLILAGDMAEPTKDSIAETVRIINLLSANQASSIEWVPGKTVFETMENPADGQALRDLAIKGNLKIATALSNGSLLTGSGTASDEVIGMIKTATKLQNLNAMTIADILNTNLMLRYDLATKIGADTILRKLAEGQSYDAILPEGIDVSAEFGMNREQLVKLLDRGYKTIFSKDGILNNTVPSQLFPRQLTVLRDIQLSPEITQIREAVVNTPVEGRSAEDGQKIMKLDAVTLSQRTEDGMVASMKISSQNMAKIDNMSAPMTPADITLTGSQRIDLDGLKDTELLLYKIKIFVATFVNRGLNSIKSLPILKSLFTSTQDRNLFEKYKSLASAA
jgi:hypothetical protein